MSTATFTIGLSLQSFPATQAPPASLSLIITQPDGTTVDQSLAATATTASATVTQTGAYTASIQALDANSNPIGSPVSASFNVSTAPTTVEFSVPTTLTASVA